MNLSPRWATVLMEAGIEAVHWSTVGPGTASDSEIMTFAKTNNYVVLTNDLDFGTILATTQGEKPSVVQIRSQDVSPEAISRQVVQAVTQMAAELEAGLLLTVDPRRSRIRMLPLRRRE